LRACLGVVAKFLTNITCQQFFFWSSNRPITVEITSLALTAKVAVSTGPLESPSYHYTTFKWSAFLNAAVGAWLGRMRTNHLPQKGLRIAVTGVAEGFAVPNVLLPDLRLADSRHGE
jgi:hypothetical protein